MRHSWRALIDRVDPPWRVRQLRTHLRATTPRSVYYLATRQHLYTIQWHLDRLGHGLADVLTPMSYDELFAQIAPPDWWDALHESAWGDETLVRHLQFEPLSGVYIFADLERLDLATTRQAALAWNALTRYGGPSVKLLNHPTRSMRRYELLRTLHERGINPFNAYRLTESPWPTKYPVFIRYLSNHASPRPQLLRSRRELERMIALIDRRGIDRNDLLIEEYVETADAQGRYRCYGAFIVGGRVFPRRISCARNWVVKGNAVWDADVVQLERAFVVNGSLFPEAPLRAIFRLAHVEYGRIDFVLHEGRLIVWEINTNPTVIPPRALEHRERDAVHKCFAENFESAVRALLAT